MWIIYEVTNYLITGLGNKTGHFERFEDGSRKTRHKRVEEESVTQLDKVIDECRK